MRSVRASLRGGVLGQLSRVPELLTSLEDHLLHVRRHRGSREVRAALQGLRFETTGLVADGSRLAKAIGLPLPRSVHEVSRVLTPHLPVRMNARVIAKPFERVLLISAPVVWLVMFWSRLPPGATPVVPIFLSVWLFQLLSLLARSVRVVLTARLFRLGRREFAVAEVRAVHVRLPGWMSGRGARAEVVVETQSGLRTTVKMPNALGPLMKTLRESGVRVIQTGGFW